MSFSYNINTSAGHNDSGEPRECSNPNSTRTAARRMSDVERNQPQSSTLRLPQIQIPPHTDLYKHHSPSPLSTCPSLHQHHQGKGDIPTPQSMLRKFFAKSDDISGLISDTRPHRGTASCIRASGRISDNEVVPHHHQIEASHSGNHLQQSFHSHPHQSFRPSISHSREHGRNSLMVSEGPGMISPCASGSTSNSEHTHEDERVWENSRQSGSSFSRNSSGLETSPFTSGFEDGGPSQGEVFRCSDCNRKCKSKASYLKHRSMMCTHRLGPLTLECRYCKRHYTYAGYLQRHEIECAKTNNA